MMDNEVFEEFKKEDKQLCNFQFVTPDTHQHDTAFGQ